MKPTPSPSINKFRFCSSIADDVWHPSKNPSAYEWWYFDALSDDGRDALVIIFLDNFVFSPRYNSASANQAEKPDAEKEIERFPAVAFCFYRDGKPLYRGINEFTTDNYQARTDFPSCQIGTSRFDFEATPYGVRYILDLNINLRKNHRLHAALEWLIVERDFLPPDSSINDDDAHFWNLASPRGDVTGRITVQNQNGAEVDRIQFRGTGYHDHNQDSRWLPATVAEWQWGRAHFPDATAVFYRYREQADAKPSTKLFLIKENKFSVHDSACLLGLKRRNIFGVKYPKQIDLVCANDYALSVRQTQIIDASFFYLRFLSEMKLDLNDGRVYETVGITEHLEPRSLHWRFIDWLVNMRIGRNGRGAFLP